MSKTSSFIAGCMTTATARVVLVALTGARTPTTAHFDTISITIGFAASRQHTARSSRSQPAALRLPGASATSAAIPEVITLNLGLIVENLSADETRTIVAKRPWTANSESRLV